MTAVGLRHRMGRSTAVVRLAWQCRLAKLKTISSGSLYGLTGNNGVLTHMSWGWHAEKRTING